MKYTARPKNWQNKNEHKNLKFTYPGLMVHHCQAPSFHKFTITSSGTLHTTVRWNLVFQGMLSSIHISKARINDNSHLNGYMMTKKKKKNNNNKKIKKDYDLAVQEVLVLTVHSHDCYAHTETPVGILEYWRRYKIYILY